jgi:hypothetical protein
MARRFLNHFQNLIKFLLLLKKLHSYFCESMFSTLVIFKCYSIDDHAIEQQGEGIVNTHRFKSELHLQHECELTGENVVL